MDFQRVMIVVGVPAEHVETLLDAISTAGGGVIGEYTHCAYTTPGVGRFKPSDAANPHIGTRQAINSVEEVRIETFCERGVAKVVTQAIRATHPYEEPVIYIIPLINEADL